MKTRPSSNVTKCKKVESKHPDSNLLLSSIIESPKEIVIFSLDRNYCYKAFNSNHKETIKNIWGTDIEIGMNMLNIIKDPKYRKKAKKNFDRALKGESFTLVEEYGEPHNRFYYEDIYSPVFDDAGQVTGLSLFLTDITEKKRTEDELNKYRNQLEDLVKQRTRELESAKKELELDITKHKQAEEEIKESTERFKAIFEQSPYSIQILSPDGFTKYVNPAWEKLWGATIDALKDYNMLEDEQLVKKGIMPYVLKGFAGEVTEVPAIEYNPVKNKVLQESTKRYASSKFFPLSFEEGKIHEIVLVHEDISERKLAEEELQETNAFLRNILESSSSVSIISTDWEGNILYWNQGAEKIFGYKSEEIVGHQKIDILYPDDEDETLKIVKDIRSFIQKNKKGTSCEIVEVTKEGRKLWAHLTLSPRLNESGELIGILGIGEDITERKLAEEALKESEAKYKEIATSIPGVAYQFMVKKDGSYAFPYVHENCEKFFHHKAKAVVADPNLIFNMVPPDELQSFIDSIEESARTLKEWRHDFRVVLPDGQECWFEGRSVPHLLPSGEPFWNGVVTDITERKQAELALKSNLDQTRRLRDIVEKLNHVNTLQDAYSVAIESIMAVIKADRASILISDPDGVVRFKAWEGLSPEYRTAVEGHFPWELSDLKAQPITIQNIKEADLSKELRATVLKEGIHACAFIPLIGKDQLLGKFMTYYNREYIFESDEMNVARVLADNLSTVIERLQSQDALVESEIKYRSIFESSIDVYYHQNKDRVVTIVSPSVRQFGYEPKDIIGTRGMDYYLDLVDRESLIVKLEKEGIVKDYEVKLKDAQGNPVWTSVNVRILRDEEENFVGMDGVLRDINERKLAEQALRESEEKFRSVIEQSNDGIYVLQRDRFVFINSRFTEITGFELEEISAEDFNFKELVAEEGLKVLEEREEMRKRGEELPGRYIFKGLRKDGQKRDLEVSVTMVEWQGDSATLGVLHDVTDRIQTRMELEEALEEARQSEKVKSLFMANMSHEIRTPLNAILGFTDLLETSMSHLISEVEKGFFDIISNSGNRLMGTVHEILDISQIEAGTYDLKKEQFDLVKLVKDLVNGVKPMADKKGLKIEYASEIDYAFIKADQYGVSQAISNIIDNSIKYTEQGKITVSLEQKAKQYVLSIQDTGIGIAEEYLDNLFEAFSQESEGYTKKFQGIGLGMAIANRHLDLNNIDINVESTKNVGTTFMLTFKSVKKRISKKQVVKEEVKVKPIAESVEKPLVLLVEDDPSSQKLMEFFLKGLYEIYFAVSVDEAKQQLKKCPVNLILLDLSLVGEEDGLDLVRWMRKTKTWQKTPVIATTAHVFTTDQNNCITAGCNNYISKPIKRERLLEKICEFV